jgi:hypothetical protein
MSGTSIHFSDARGLAPALPKGVRSAAVIGALLLTSFAVNALIVAADTRTNAANGGAVVSDGDRLVCADHDSARLASHHPFRGALAPLHGACL